MLKKFIRWSVTLAYAAGVFYLSVMPSGGPEFFPHQDKVIHFVMYAGMAFLFVWLLRVTSLRSWQHLPLLAAGFAIAYGALNEFNQIFISYRSAEVGDLAANFVGATVGAFAGMIAARAMDARRARVAELSSGERQ